MNWKVILVSALITAIVIIAINKFVVPAIDGSYDEMGSYDGEEYA